VAYEHLDFLKLMMKIGGGPELIQYHNVWVLTRVEDTDPYTFEKWGEVMHLLRQKNWSRRYDFKLYEWACEQKSAGAGPD
jgi:hypothetical protein